MKNTDHYIYQLKKKGYTIISDLISKKECIYLKKKLEELHDDLKKNKNFIDEGSNKGQIIIRDLPLRQPEVFLKYLSLNKILKILSKIFDDKFILDNMMASNSINVKKKYNRKVHID